MFIELVPGATSVPRTSGKYSETGTLAPGFVIPVESTLVAVGVGTGALTYEEDTGTEDLNGKTVDVLTK